MGKRTDTFTDFDKQLIAGMEEVVAHINGAPNSGRATVVEFADAKAIREGLGMSQAVFSRAYGIPLKTLQHWEQRVWRRILGVRRPCSRNTTIHLRCVHTLTRPSPARFCSSSELLWP